MKNLTNFADWIADLQKIINSSKPRGTLNLLRANGCHFSPICYTSPLTSDQLEELLATLVDLRNSRCNGRLEHEKSILKNLQYTCKTEVSFDKPCDDGEDLFPELEPVSNEEKTEHLKFFNLLANHAHQLLLSKPIKLKEYDKLLLEAFSILDVLTYRPELKPILSECLSLTRARINKGDKYYASSAVEFIDRYYYNFTKNQKIPKEIIKELDELASRTEHEHVLFSINNILVDLGEICAFAALDSMESFREKNDPFYSSSLEPLE